MRLITHLGIFVGVYLKGPCLKRWTALARSSGEAEGRGPISARRRTVAVGQGSLIARGQIRISRRDTTPTENKQQPSIRASLGGVVLPPESPTIMAKFGF